MESVYTFSLSFTHTSLIHKTRWRTLQKLKKKAKKQNKQQNKTKHTHTPTQKQNKTLLYPLKFRKWQRNSPVSIFNHMITALDIESEWCEKKTVANLLLFPEANLARNSFRRTSLCEDDGCWEFSRERIENGKKILINISNYSIRN